MRYLADGKRLCARCGRYRSPRSFPPGRVSDGLSSYCKPCAVAATREWRAANRETYNEGTRRSYAARADEINERRRARYAEQHS